MLESMMDAETISGGKTFRAAAFYRLVFQVYVACRKFDCMDLDKRLLEDCSGDTPESHIHIIVGNMILQMNTGGAVAIFPHQDPQIMAQVIMYIVNCYKLCPQINGQIALLFTTQAVGSILTGLNHSDSRSKEIMSLNMFCYQLSKEMERPEEWKITAEFVEGVIGSEFHVESQFLHFTAERL